MGKNNGQPQYVMIAEAIKEMEEVDVLEYSGPYPHRIQWLIALHLLKDRNEYERHKEVDEVVRYVKNNLEHAYSYLENQGIPIYRYADKANGKTIVYLTVNRSNAEAKERNFARIILKVETKIRAARSEVEVAHPEKLRRLESVIQKRLSG